MERKADFSPLAKYLQFFDTDFFDVGRAIETEDRFGNIIFTDPEIPLYENLACHCVPSNRDNPDPLNAMTQPVFETVEVFCNVHFDVKTGDLITVRKTSPFGDILKAYRGRASEPVVRQARQTFLFTQTS